MKIIKILLLILFTGVATPAWPQTSASLSLQFSNGYPRLGISGSVSNACTVQSSTNLTQINPWHYQTYFQLTNSHALFVDTNQPPSGLRFYRVFTQQLPTNVVPVTNMIWISPGTFTMGSPSNEALRGSDETQHTVTFSHGFYMGQYLVTQTNYQALTSNNPSFFTFLPQSTNRPVDSVEWSDATNYCALLTKQEQTAGRTPTNWVYRLPTESEWEYACRAGTTTAFYYGNDLLSGMANFDGTNEYDATIGTIYNPSGTYLQQTTVVGNYQPNAWGLFDMCGNVLEWCQDLYGPYPAGPVTDPQGATTGTDYVLRGGDWNAAGQYCRSAQRFNSSTTAFFVGFRIVLAPSP